MAKIAAHLRQKLRREGSSRIFRARALILGVQAEDLGARPKRHIGVRILTGKRRAIHDGPARLQADGLAPLVPPPADRSDHPMRREQREDHAGKPRGRRGGIERGAEQPPESPGAAGGEDEK